MIQSSIVIPCYNEVKTFRPIIHQIREQKEFESEIIVVDDFSTDGASDILTKQLNNRIEHLICNEKNYGKGYCIRKGIQKASDKIILIQDADLEYDP